jgi:hypothetical protein
MNRVILAAMLLLAACSDGNGGDGNGPPAGGTDRSAALDAASASAEETEQAVDAIAGTASALSPQGLRAGLRALVIPPRPLCATASSTTDSDGDGTLDNAVYTYALPACAFTDFRGGGTLELTGGIQVSDEDPLPGFAYRLEYQGFAWNLVARDSAASFKTTRNGMRQLALENGTLVLNSALTMQRSFDVRGEGFVASDIRSVFTPAAGSALAFGQPMPAGTVEQSGAVTMIRAGVTERYDVRTVTPLGIDPTCAGFPRISAGEVHYVLPDSSYVRVTWPGCGVAAVQEFVEK